MVGLTGINSEVGLFPPSTHRGFRWAFRELIYASRPIILLVFSLTFGLVATDRTFGFDSLRDLYPHLIADGWGVWYWLAVCGLGYHLYSLIVNVAFAAMIFTVSVPSWRECKSSLISVLSIGYFAFWFLFGQARYGMALALIAPAAVLGGDAAFLTLGILAFFVHKGVAGGFFLLWVWRILRHRKSGIVLGIAVATILYFILHFIFGGLLELAGYANYAGWANLPSANTPLKFFYLIAVLLLWFCRERSSPRTSFILTLIFFPLAYFNVFAGRGFQLYSIVLFSILLRVRSPLLIRILILIPYVADLLNLLFTSGFYF